MKHIPGSKQKWTAVWVLLLLFTSRTLFAEETVAFSPAIEDNSFLIEEAYNQEAGVVQHISNGLYFSHPQSILGYSFTQEWPASSQLHQISVTVPYAFQRDSSAFGDVLLNYRYQLMGHDAWAAVSPRISAIIPTGNKTKGTGLGAPGLQVNIPVSKRLSEKWVSHFNAGFTYFPHVESESDAAVEKSLSSYNLGASIIWLAKPEFNLLLEYTSAFSSEIEEKGTLAHSVEHVISPGFRYAINVRHLQIVPGLAAPFSFKEGKSRTGVFVYLSLEHPF